MKKILKNYKGFTLVELLVVVAIIAILSVVGLTLFNGAQINARDARRKADIDAIANALEIKREPGKIVYKLISASDMSSGTIPVDSVNSVKDVDVSYCIKAYTTDSGARDDATSPSWSVTDSNGNITSGLVCPTGFYRAMVGTGFAFETGVSKPFTDAAGVADKKSWKICAKLEGSGGNAYCKNSAQ